MALLAVAGAGAAFASDWFVGALEPAIEALGISQAFAGLVIVAIAGNAVENVVGIVLAAKGDADLAISVVKNSVAQVAVFLFPLLVLVSFLFSDHLTFQLAPVYVGAIAAHRDRAVADHRRRRGDDLRGRRADRDVRHARRVRLARLRLSAAAA